MSLRYSGVQQVLECHLLEWKTCKKVFLGLEMLFMAYQPLYAWVTDNRGGCGHTLSLRGLVTSTTAVINTYDGQAVKVYSYFEDGRTLVDKPDLRTIPKNKRQEIIEQYEKEVEENTTYSHGIRLSVDLKNHNFLINGYKLTEEDKTVLQDHLLKRIPEDIVKKEFL